MLRLTRIRWFTIGYAKPFLAGVLAVSLAAIFAGCGRKTIAPQTGPAGAPSTSAESGRSQAPDHASTGHSHIAPHSGQVQAVGENHFELVYEGEAGRFVLYVLGSEETKPEPIGDQSLTLQVRDEASGQLQSLTLAADPLEGEAGGRSSRFTGTSDELAKLDKFTAVVRVPVAGEPHRVSFQFVGGKPMSAGLAASGAYACPMACEKDKVYPQPGKCPVCKMKLEEHKAGGMAHADHNPKHGGVFFMAPDNWHHLEGTLVTEHELRIYLYDNFTKPMDSAGYTGKLKVQPVNDQDEGVGDAVTVPIKPVEGKPYLVAQLPESLMPPYQTEARLQVPKQKDEFLFNFDFKATQHKD